MKRMKKMLSVIISVILMTTTLLVPVSANEVAADVGEHWAEATVKEWMNEGLINGYADGSFKPNVSIKRAEFYTLIDNIIGLQESAEAGFVDVHSSDWYNDVVLKAAEAGLAGGYNDGTFRPEQPITRQEVAVVVANMMNYDAKSSYPHVSQFTDGYEVADWAISEVDTLIEKGLIQGNNKQLNISSNITRAEAVTLLNRAFGAMYLVEGTYGGTEEDLLTIEGNATISSADIILENVIIEGDLYVAEGVADGEVNLDNVVVKGNTLIKGGGENSIYFNNVTVEGAVVVKKTDNKIRLVASGRTEIKATILASGAILVEKELIGGGFERITIPKEVVAGAEIEFDGEFDEVNVEAKDIQIRVDDKAKIGKMNVKDGADNVKIDGKGTIEEVEVDDDVDGTEVDGKDVKGGETSTAKTDNDSNTGSSGGGSSSGGSSGGGSSPGDSDQDDEGTPETPPSTTSGAIYIDSRFAAGYPSVSVNEDGYVVMKVKLAEASEANPVTVHYIADKYNTDDYSSVESILHGHAGIEYPYHVYDSGDLEIVDTQEHSITTWMRITDTDFATCEFVLVDKDNVSEEVTRVEIGEMIYDELDTYSPNFSIYDATYIDKTYTSIAIPLTEKVVVENGAEASFSISVMNATTSAAISVTDVKYHAANEHYDYLILEVSGLSTDVSPENINIDYNNQGLIYDVSTDKNQLESDQVQGITILDPTLDKWLISEDYMYNILEVNNGANDYVYETIVVKGINANNEVTELIGHNYGCGYSNDWIEFEVFVEEPGEYDSYLIEVDFIDIMGNTLTLTTENIVPEVIPEVTFDSAEFNALDGFLTINYTGELDHGFACMFTLLVNDEEVIPKGSLFVPDGEGFIEFEAEQLGVDIETGDIVKVKYEPKHQDYFEDYLGREVEVTGQWIDVQINN